MSCSLRDAVLLEACGVPTVILANDVFEPIARATATLVGMPEEQLARTVVWLPHPTSNLTAAAAEALIDERIGAIRAAFSGAAVPLPSSLRAAAPAGDALAVARDAVRTLTLSLRADGADLALDAYAGGVLDGVLRITDPAACDGGACIMPAPVLATMIESLVRPHLPELVRVVLTEETSPTT